MGLDQYLIAKRYVGDWKHSDAEERNVYAAVSKAVGADGWRCAGSPSLQVELNVAYWRKANQIHNWFVQTVQDGKDDCGTYYVDRKHLVELRDICKSILASTTLIQGQVKNGEMVQDGKWVDVIERGKIMADTKLAEKLLPRQQGFFFGGSGYDQWYWHDLENTVKQIDAALEYFNDDDWMFYYHSSW
jgi:hypothetical protein